MQTYSQELQSEHESFVRLRLVSHLLIRATFWFSLLRKTKFSKNHAGKKIRFRLVCSTLSTIFPRLCPKWFQSSSFSTKCFEWQKLFFKKIKRKCLGKTSWARSQLNFTWEESTNYLINGKRWFKTIVNIRLTEINP